MAFDKKKQRKLNVRKAYLNRKGVALVRRGKELTLCWGVKMKNYSKTILWHVVVYFSFFCWDELDATKAMLIVPLSIAVNKIRLESRVE